MVSRLQARERTRLRQFLASPYFNQRTDVLALWDHLSEQAFAWPELSRTDIWQAVYPGEAFDGKRFRLLVSYLTRLIERFLAVEAFEEDTFSVKMTVARQWRKRAAPKLHLRWLREADKALEKTPYRHADYFRRRYDWQLDWYRQAYEQTPESGEAAKDLAQAFDLALLTSKLRQNCLLLAHARVYPQAYQADWWDQWLDQLQVDDLPPEPTVLAYWHCTQMLRRRDGEQHFQRFKELLVRAGQQFPPEEARDLQLLAINYGIRQVNEGNPRYFRDILDLYQAGLDQGYLLRDGVLSRFTYHNIVAVALQVEDPDWAQTFIDTWTPQLERRYRERMYNFSRAKIAYAQRRYADALPYLQQANYHDPLLNLGARALLLKIHFELDEWDVLQSHLDAFQTYLRRNRGLGYHRLNYQNLIRYTRKLLKLAPHDRAGRKRLREAILHEKALTEKEWLLQQLTDG